MKQTTRKPLLGLLAALALGSVVMAQPGEKDKVKEKKSDEVITIIRSGDSDEKVVVEVNGDKVTVNGKPLDEYKSENVKVRKAKNTEAWSFSPGQNWAFSGADNYRAFSIDSNRAMLGVTTDKHEKGAEIQGITKESAAEKAGLKKGDIILSIDDDKIESPDQLSKSIKGHKPGDKVKVTYLRDDKKETATAELGRYKGARVYSTSPGNFNFDMDEMNLGQIMPRMEMPRIEREVLGYRTPSPKLGLSVQDTDEGKGVKVIEVDDESNASKAGIKEDDVILEVEGKATNSADEIAKIIKESKERRSVMVKLQRGGKTHNIEVRMPRKLKTADL